MDLEPVLGSADESETVREQVYGTGSSRTVGFHVPKMDPNSEWFLDDWLQDKAVDTKRKYERAVRSLRDFLEDKALRQVTVQDLSRWRGHILEEAPERSRTGFIFAIKSLFNFKTAARIIDWNPTRLLRAPPPPMNAGPERSLTREQVAAILEACRGKSKAIFSAIYYGGLRVFECAKLDRQHVHVGVRVKIDVWGKGAKLRVVELGASGSEIMRDWLERKDVGRWLFSWRGEKHMTSHAIRRRLKTVLKRLEPTESMPDWTVVSPHWLRHAFATHAYDAGADIAALSKILGHADTKTTLRYLHTNSDVAGTLDD